MTANRLGISIIERVGSCSPGRRRETPSSLVSLRQLLFPCREHLGRFEDVEVAESHDASGRQPVHEPVPGRAPHAATRVDRTAVVRVTRVPSSVPEFRDEPTKKKRRRGEI